MNRHTLFAVRAPLLAHPALHVWTTRLRCWDGELTPLLARLAHRVAARVERLPLRAMVPARAMLCDYMNRLRPGSDGSLLHGATELELDLISGALALQIVEAAAAEALEPRFMSAPDVAMAITAWAREEAVDEFLRGWIQLSTAAGVTPADFLHVELQH